MGQFCGLSGSLADIIWPLVAMGSAGTFIVSAPGLIESDMSRWEGEAASELIIVAYDQFQISLGIDSMERI